MALRAVVDDFVHALIRTQHVDSPAGNIFTGGLEEALFDLQIGKITNPDYRVGSPAAGMLFIYYIRPSSKYLMPTPIDRRPPAPRITQRWNQSSYVWHILQLRLQFLTRYLS